jgi:hypothetical protein
MVNLFKLESIISQSYVKSSKNKWLTYRIWGVLPMVHNTQNYWVPGVCPPSKNSKYYKIPDSR